MIGVPRHVSAAIPDAVTAITLRRSDWPRPAPGAAGEARPRHPGAAGVARRTPAQPGSPAAPRRSRGRPPHPGAAGVARRTPAQPGSPGPRPPASRPRHLRDTSPAPGPRPPAASRRVPGAAASGTDEEMLAGRITLKQMNSDAMLHRNLRNLNTIKHPLICVDIKTIRLLATATGQVNTERGSSGQGIEQSFIPRFSCPHYHQSRLLFPRRGSCRKSSFPQQQLLPPQ